MRSATAALAAMIAMIALAGCGGPGPDPDPDAGLDAGLDPTVGQLIVAAGPDDGSPGLLELTDGQEMTLIPGAQGGFHLMIGARVPGTMGAPVTFERQARRADTNQLVSQARQRLELVPSSISGLLETGQATPMFLCPTPIGISILDQTLLVRIRAESADGTKAEGTIRVAPKCPTDAQADFCRRICAG